MITAKDMVDAAVAHEVASERVVKAIMSAGAEFWHDPDGEAYVTLRSNGHHQRYAVDSAEFVMTIRSIYGKANRGALGTPRPIPKKTLDEAIETCKAIAREGRSREADLRVVGDAANVWIDLGDQSWAVVHVTKDGWQIIENADVPLIRSPGMRSLPRPIDGDPQALDRLLDLMNLGTKEQRILVIAWIVGCYWARGPYAILAIDGEAGSGKSSATRFLRQMTDPHKAPIRAAPKAGDDFWVAARHNRVPTFDNLSNMSETLADELCRLATGGGSSKRSLYTNGAEYSTSVCRPALLNGIPPMLERGDLAERSLALTLRAIGPNKRRPESAIRAEFERLAPASLGVILDCLAHAMRRLPIELPTLPRMADFAMLACAALEHLGFHPEETLKVLDGNRAASTEAIAENDPIARAIQDAWAAGNLTPNCCGSGPCRDESCCWQGTATDLLRVLNLQVGMEVSRDRAWPKNPTQLSGRVRRVAGALRAADFDVVMPDSGGRSGRMIEIRYTGKWAEAGMAEPSRPVTREELELLLG